MFHHPCEDTLRLVMSGSLLVFCIQVGAAIVNKRHHKNVDIHRPAGSPGSYLRGEDVQKHQPDNSGHLYRQRPRWASRKMKVLKPLNKQKGTEPTDEKKSSHPP